MKAAIMFLLIFSFSAVYSQDEAELMESNASRFEENPENQPDDEGYARDLEYYSEHKINLNSDDTRELEELNMLTPIQLDDLQHYKKTMGKLICLQELQAVPGWDIPTIRKLLPFVSVSQSFHPEEQLRDRLNKGEHFLMTRIAMKPGITRKDAPTRNSSFQGSPVSLLMRYSYSYKNLLQYGILGEKDPGEAFFKGSMKQGFDFYSFHVFARGMGAVKSLAIGDYTVNLGQGLVYWQSLAFGKSSTPINIKRQSEVLHPYRSAGEFNFERGAGITLVHNCFELTMFLSRRNLSANIVTDSLNEHPVTVSTIQASGYHRTPSELADKNTLSRSTAGGTLRIKREHFTIGLNAVAHHYSKFLQKKEEPYHLFSIKGFDWLNYSVDFDATFHPAHVFGEMAMDMPGHPALVCGLMTSLDHAVDMALLYRNIRPGYQSVAGNAFTENALPENEEGLYLGVSIHLSQELQLDGYADIFRFPWLKYRVDAPSNGNDYLLQLSYRPDKKISCYSKWKMGNTALSENVDVPITTITTEKTISWRTHVSYQLTRSFLVENRLEWKRSILQHALIPAEGFLAFTEISFHPQKQIASGSLRLQYFEAPGFGSRIYAYEKDLQYAHSIPSFYGKGFRYYLNLRIRPRNTGFHFMKLIKACTISIKWAQTLEFSYERGADNSVITSIGKKEIRVQLNIGW